MKIKPTVTIGIPAYNEKENIVFLLESIFEQTQHLYTLEKVIVVSDGSTDGMDERVARMALKHPQITLISDGKRIGKSKRLNKLYQENKSDIFIQLDADIIPTHAGVIEELIKPFKSHNVVVVSGERVPLSQNNFVARLILKKNQLWRDIRISLVDPNIIVNCISNILALRQSFARTLVLNPGITSQSQMTYCEVIKRHLNFRFAPKASIYYTLPSTLLDYLAQTKRSTNETDQLAKLYGQQIKHYDQIPTSVRIHILIKNLFSDPFMTIASLFFFYAIQFIPFQSAKIKKVGVWEIVKSTKKGINMNNI